MKLIVEMEMPCNIQYLAGLHGTPTCPIERRMCKDANNPPSWCPIKGELPEQHGDLIDRQDAIKEFEPYAEYESNRSNAEWVQRIKTLLNFMPPVIAAERKDDE